MFSRDGQKLSSKPGCGCETGLEAKTDARKTNQLYPRRAVSNCRLLTVAGARPANCCPSGQCFSFQVKQVDRFDRQPLASRPVLFWRWSGSAKKWNTS